MTDQNNLRQQLDLDTEKEEKAYKTISLKCSINDLRAIDSAAKELGKTRSSWLLDIIREELHNNY